MAEAAQKIGGMATSGWRIVFIHGHGILWNEEPLLQIDDGHNCNVNNSEYWYSIIFSECILFATSAFVLHTTKTPNVKGVGTRIKSSTLILIHIFTWCSCHSVRETDLSPSRTLSPSSTNWMDTRYSCRMSAWACPPVRIILHFHIHALSQRERRSALWSRWKQARSPSFILSGRATDSLNCIKETPRGNSFSRYEGNVSMSYLKSQDHKCCKYQWKTNVFTGTRGIFGSTRSDYMHRKFFDRPFADNKRTCIHAFAHPKWRPDPLLP